MAAILLSACLASCASPADIGITGPGRGAPVAASRTDPDDAAVTPPGAPAGSVTYAPTPTPITNPGSPYYGHP